MTEKMGNTEHKEDDSFALYTEKIVPKPSVKYRRLIRAAKFFAAAVLFGLIASGVIWVLALLVRNQDYLGIGGEVMRRAVAGEVVWYAFLAKMIFTAVTLGGGFKGGEIVPSFFIGATFGCLFGHLLGISPSLCAAVGMAALFCGVTNCPITSLLISVELFSADGLLCYAVVCAVSYVCSGYRGLYSSQTILYSKLRAEFINVHTK